MSEKKPKKKRSSKDITTLVLKKLIDSGEDWEFWERRAAFCDGWASAMEKKVADVSIDPTHKLAWELRDHIKHFSPASKDGLYYYLILHAIQDVDWKSIAASIARSFYSSYYELAGEWPSPDWRGPWPPPECHGTVCPSRKLKPLERPNED